MFKCKQCKAIFEEPKEIHTTYEIELGIANDVSSSTPLTLIECPYCSSTDIYEGDENEEELENE